MSTSNAIYPTNTDGLWPGNISITPWQHTTDGASGGSNVIDVSGGSVGINDPNGYLTYAPATTTFNIPETTDQQKIAFLSECICEGIEVSEFDIAKKKSLLLKLPYIVAEGIYPELLNKVNAQLTLEAHPFRAVEFTQKHKARKAKNYIDYDLFLQVKFRSIGIEDL
jgi:hypothetical protein